MAAISNGVWNCRSSTPISIPVLGVDWGRRDFLRRAGGALIAQITLSILGSPKSVKVEHEPASPKPPVEISVEPADAHTYTQMLRHAFNNTHVLRISRFLKAQGFAPYESPSVMWIRESNKLVRTVAIHRYVTDGQEAVLVLVYVYGGRSKRSRMGLCDCYP